MTTCIVLGGAACVWDDLETYTGPCDGVAACNAIGAEYGNRLDAWVSLHPEHLLQFAAARVQRLLRPAPLYSHRQPVPASRGHIDVLTDIRFPGHADSGGSGLFAVKVALVDLGFDRVVLCGIPLDDAPHFDGKPSPTIPQNRAAWEAIPTEYKARMRSMSGWTREHMGAPDGF